MIGREASRSREAAFVAGTWFWSVTVAKDTRALVSAMIGWSVVLSIQIVVNTLREIGRAFPADCGQTKEGLPSAFPHLAGSGFQTLA